MDSYEFSEWLAYWSLTAEMSGLVDHAPTPDEVGGRIAAAFALHNAKVAAKQERR